ncbi:CDP-alcohol phosphatidyltransferase family protein, partial [Mycobacterium tuberculosis]
MVRTEDPAARIVTVPNVITVARLLLLTPLFVVLLLVVDSPFWALVVAVVLGGTDWVDGQVARRFHQVSDL